MSTVRQTLIVTWKELRLILADKGSLAVLFLLPLLFSSMYGTINQQLAQESESPTVLVNAYLVNEDTGPFGERIAQALGEIAVLRVEILDSAETAERRVAEGRAAAAIILPADLSQRIADYSPTTMEVIVDPAQPEAAGIVRGIMNHAVNEVVLWGEVQHGVHIVLGEAGLPLGDPETQRAIEAQNLGIIMTRIDELRRNPALRVVQEDLEGAVITGGIELFFAHLFPAFTVMFVFFIVGMAGASLLNERDAGTLRRLLAAPVSRTAVIGGKVLGYMTLVCMQVIVLFGIAHLLFGMPLGDSPLGLVVLTLVLAMVATSLGMMIASLARSPKQADSIGTVLGFVLAGMGGAIAVSATPITRSGGPMSIVARLTPHGHALEAYYSLMAERAGMIDVLPELGALLAMGLAFAAVAIWRFRTLE